MLLPITILHPVLFNLYPTLEERDRSKEEFTRRAQSNNHVGGDLLKPLVHCEVV
jgi:hypothetical protein